MKISDDGLAIIKKYEGLRLNAYRCPARVWTIGYGHTHQVKSGDVITEAMATEYLRGDVRHAQQTIERYVKVDLTQSQFDALVSFIFNVGSGAFRKSTLLRMLNKGNYSGAEKQFKRWNKAKGKALRGLTRRRADEAELFSNEENVDDMPQAIDAPEIKTKMSSKTNIASGVGVVALGASQLETVSNAVNKITDVTQKGGDIADNVGGLYSASNLPIIAFVAVVCIFGFIIYERNKKVDEHGI